MISFLQFLKEFSYKEIDRDRLHDELWDEIQSQVGMWKGSGTSSRAHGTQGGIVVYFNGKMNFASAKGDMIDIENGLGKKYKDAGGSLEVKVSDYDKENDQGWITILVG